MLKLRRILAALLMLTMLLGSISALGEEMVELTPDQIAELTGAPEPAEPTLEPTPEPTVEATVEPTAEPTAEPPAHRQQCLFGIPSSPVHRYTFRCAAHWHQCFQEV